MKKLTEKEQKALDLLDDFVNIEYLLVREDRKADEETIDFEGFANLKDIAAKISAHDAQIRAEALDFANAEKIDNGEELLKESLSEAIKEYLLYGAHPLSTEDDSDDIWDDAELFNLKLTNGDVIDCSELVAEVLDALKRYLSGQPILQSIPVKGAEQ